MNWTWFLFSFKGRFNRAKFWLTLVILMVAGWIMSAILMVAIAGPLASDLSAASAKCQNITDKAEKSNCINTNTPAMAAMTAAMKKCDELGGDEATVKKCEDQAVMKNMGEMSAGLSKSLLLLIPVYFVYCWISLAAYVKRFHDLDKSGWFTLLYFIPLVNLGVFIWQGFFKGTTGANRFGPDPLQGKVVV